jgi:hypothetical protein
VIQGKAKITTSTSFAVVRRRADGAVGRVSMGSCTFGLSSRSSLMSLSMAAQQSIVDGTPDDINIATELLTRPHVLHRETSFSGTSFGRQSSQDLHIQGGFNGSIGGSTLRRAIQTSNTWTSSSSEILSEHDDMEDRSLFVDEYNRLAKKVCGNEA